jgi:hypothetical protein
MYMSQPAALKAWNMFQKAHKGQGLTQKELSTMFHSHRAMAPVLMAEAKPAKKKRAASAAAKKPRRKCLTYA